MSNQPLVTYFTGRDEWLLVRRWCDTIGGSRICVPAGFLFDMASIPWFLRWHTNIYHLSIRASLVHDYIYRYRGVMPPLTIRPNRVFTRKEADLIFRILMKQQGVKKTRGVFSYWAVRLFGWYPWAVSGTPFNGVEAHQE